MYIQCLTSLSLSLCSFFSHCFLHFWAHYPSASHLLFNRFVSVRSTRSGGSRKKNLHQRSEELTPWCKVCHCCFGTFCTVQPSRPICSHSILRRIISFFFFSPIPNVLMLRCPCTCALKLSPLHLEHIIVTLTEHLLKWVLAPLPTANPPPPPPQQDIAQWQNRVMAVWRRVGAGQGERCGEEFFF